MISWTGRGRWMETGPGIWEVIFEPPLLFGPRATALGDVPKPPELHQDWFPVSLLIYFPPPEEPIWNRIKRRIKRALTNA